jgi:hypothetical protein
MTDFAQLELELMARARRAIEPTADDRARLRNALAVKIAAAGAATVATQTLASIREKPWRHLINTHLVGLSSVAAITAAAAFGAGFYAGHRTRAVVVKTIAVVQPSASTAPSSLSAAPSQPLSVASLASSSIDMGHSVARPRAESSPAPTALPSGTSIAEELELLKRAEHTLRQGNSHVALGLLEELDRRFPKGQLLEERTAARVMARCQLDDEERARARGNAYVLAHGQSVYSDRVRQMCHLQLQPTKDSPASGD